jgi:hypothetical protein
VGEHISHTFPPNTEIEAFFFLSAFFSFSVFGGGTEV